MTIPAIPPPERPDEDFNEDEAVLEFEVGDDVEDVEAWVLASEVGDNVEDVEETVAA